MWQKWFDELVDFNFWKESDYVKFIYQLFMKIDRRFEEALGVGPRFIMKGVYVHSFGLIGMCQQK